MTTHNATATDQVEPVAWMYSGPECSTKVFLRRQSMGYVRAEVETPLYTHPPTSNPVDDRETLSGFQEDEVEAVARAIQDAHTPGHPINYVSLYQARAAIAALSTLQAKRDQREREAVVAWLRKQSDIGADRGISSEKGSTRRAAYGGGSLALKRAADAIEAGQHMRSGKDD